MSSKKILLVYGAGAIGRGFIPWVFPPKDFEYYYVETNSQLRNQLNLRKSFTAYKTTASGYVSLEVPILKCYNLSEEKEVINQVHAVLTAVGPRNIIRISESLTKTQFPVLCLENDFSVPQTLKNATQNPNIVFGIPDVITSNTAPPQLLEKDPLAIITEDGVCFIDEQVSILGGNAKYISKKEIVNQWLAKLYLHNTPHCIAAYLGSFTHKTYIHEAMQNSLVVTTVSGAMEEMKSMLLKKYDLSQDFLNWYCEKELQRFQNQLLFDPISRVAREPFRKLAPNDRLIGAAELCLSCGILPSNIFIGIMAAFCYENPQDPDFAIAHLMRALNPQDFLKIIIRLRPAEALYEALLKGWDVSISFLRSLSSQKVVSHEC